VTRDQVRRWAALAGALTGLAGGVLMTVGVSALPHPWISGYVSEAGAPDARLAAIYRTGVLLLALTLILIGTAAGWSERVRLGTVGLGGAGLVGVCLVVAGGVALVSSRVSCTAGCPLPPYAHTTAQDLLHAGSSMAAIGLTTLAMLITALASTHRTRARIARVSFAISAPLLAALAIALLAIGRSTATAVLERAALLAVLGWVVAYAVDLSRS
jgi:hypothetical protein